MSSKRKQNLENNINVNTNIDANNKKTKAQPQKAGCKSKQKKVVNGEKLPKKPPNAYLIFSSEKRYVVYINDVVCIKFHITR